jgi:hypothetical protein
VTKLFPSCQFPHVSRREVDKRGGCHQSAADQGVCQKTSQSSQLLWICRLAFISLFGICPIEVQKLTFDVGDPSWQMLRQATDGPIDFITGDYLAGNQYFSLL